MWWAFCMNKLKTFLKKHEGFINFVWFVFITYLVVTFLYKSVDLSFLRSEIVAYPLLCIEGETKCIKLNKKVFTVNKQGQTIIKDEEGLGLRIFKDCAIKNRKSWECKKPLNTNPTSYETFGFREGKYFSDTERFSVYTSKIKYELSPDNFKD